MGGCLRLNAFDSASGLNWQVEQITEAGNPTSPRIPIPG